MYDVSVERLAEVREFEESLESKPRRTKINLREDYPSAQARRRFVYDLGKCCLNSSIDRIVEVVENVGELELFVLANGLLARPRRAA